MSFLDQVRADFEIVAASDFSEAATISDGVRTIEIPCLFDEAATKFDPDTQSMVIYPGSMIVVAETATDFNLRRGGLLVSVRGNNYKTRSSDWTYDGYGQLAIYLDQARA